MNTFGSTSLQFPLYDPRSVIQDRSRFRRSRVDLLDRINSFYCPVGCSPFRGWILLQRSDYDQLDRYSTALILNVGDTNDSDNVNPLRHLSIVQAQCVTRGIASDDNALYMVELTDARGVLYNEWFQFPLTAAYNIRAPAYPSTDRGGTFQPSSMNTGVSPTTTWTWTTMLQDMWTKMPLLGSWPGLPSGVALSGTPEGFWFTGVPAWPALCDVLDHLGLTVACDLTQDSPYTIVRPGSADTAYSVLETLYVPNLEDDLEWIDVGSGRVPSVVTVLFKRRNDVYGTEETTPYRNDSMAQQWDMKFYHPVSINAPSEFSTAAGTHFIWSDLTVRYDMDSVIYPADAALATEVAQDRVNNYFANVYSQTLGNMDKTYTGALPFATGSKVDGVRWFMGYGDRYGGSWRTHIVRGSDPLWPQVYKEQYK